MKVLSNEKEVKFANELKLVQWVNKIDFKGFDFLESNFIGEEMEIVFSRKDDIIEIIIEESDIFKYYRVFRLELFDQCLTELQEFLNDEEKEDEDYYTRHEDELIQEYRERRAS